MGGKCTTCLSLSGPARREGAERAGATIIRFSPRAAAHSQNADWTRAPGAAAAAAATERSPACPALPRPAWRARPGPGERGPRLPALAAPKLLFPLVPPVSLPTRVPVFVFTSKGSATKVENESDEQTKEGDGAGEAKLSVGASEVVRSPAGKGNL